MRNNPYRAVYNEVVIFVVLALAYHTALIRLIIGISELLAHYQSLALGLGGAFSSLIFLDTE
jgi:hypothetical protein